MTEPDGDLDALTRDGHVAQLRPLRRTDLGALRDVLDRCSDRSVFLRFFALDRAAARRYVDELVARPRAGDATEVAVVDGRIVGFASYAAVNGVRGDVAILVDDQHQHTGVGALLLETLAARARVAGLRELVADVLAENAGMLRLLRDLGYRVETTYGGGAEQLVWHLEPIATAEARLVERDREAAVNSLVPLLRPRAIAVVGASERPRSVGRAVFQQLCADFRGRVYAVNPHRLTVLGRECFPSPAALPEAPDVAILAVPSAAAVASARACAERGVRALVVLGSGFREAGPDGLRREAELLDVARDHGLRVVGPNCLGVLNTEPDVRLRATLADLPLRHGAVGLAAQSGALGIAAVADLDRHGVGVSQFVSLGNKVDVSGNDLLQWWHGDADTRVIGLYLESFGNPARFRSVARAVSRDKPVVALKAGRSAAGVRAGASHTAAAATADDLVDALCAQAGVARVDTLEQLVAALRVLSSQPLPAGPNVAIVGNSGGPEILAADGAEAHGLHVPLLTGDTAARLESAFPSIAAAGNPVDLGAEMSAHDLTTAVSIAAASPQVDAVAVVVCETAALRAMEIQLALARLEPGPKPIVVTVLGPQPVPQSADGPPVFDYPETAIGALATAWRCAALRAAAAVPSEPSVPSATARELIAAQPDGWLGAADAHRLLTAYGLPLADQRVATTAAAAVSAADELGYPVVIKAEGIVHKTEQDAIRLGVADPEQARAAAGELLRIAPAVVVQPTLPATTELLVGAVRSDRFGPAVVLAAGGTSTALQADRALRLAPLTTEDVSQMMAALRCRAVFDGFRGSAPVSRAAVAAVVTAVSRLMTEQPRVAELDLNPLRCAGDQVVVVDAKIRLAPPPATGDPLLRSLRTRPRPVPAATPAAVS